MTTATKSKTDLLVEFSVHANQVTFHPHIDCIVQFEDPRMFGREFLKFRKEEVRTLTYLEETRTHFVVYSVDRGTPSGPIITP